MIFASPISRTAGEAVFDKPNDGKLLTLFILILAPFGWFYAHSLGEGGMARSHQFRFICIAIVICSAITAGAQINSKSDQLTSQLHTFLGSVFVNGEFSGTVPVRKNDKTIYEESFGFADYENRIPFGDDSRFEVASVTKTFTAAAILRLRDQRKLTLDDKLGNYLPDFPHADVITRQLLSHSSGVGELPGTWANEEHTLAEVVAGIGKQPFFFAPGTSERYSNSGFILLAAIVEKISGQSYEAFLRKNLFKPLGMEHTGNYGMESIISGRVHKYQPGPAPTLVWNVGQQSLSYTLGAGSALTTATDLVLWARAIREKRVFTQSIGEYPYGWGRDSYFGHRVLLQSGLHDGASALVATFPEEQIDLVYLSNIQTGFFNECAKDIAAILFGQSVQEPVPLESHALSGKQLQAWAGTYRANDRLAFQLEDRGDSLLFRWTDQTKSSYVRPTSETSLFLPIEAAQLTIDGPVLPTGSIQRIRWKSSFDELHFVREPKNSAAVGSSGEELGVFPQRVEPLAGFFRNSRRRRGLKPKNTSGLSGLPGSRCPDTNLS